MTLKTISNPITLTPSPARGPSSRWACNPLADDAPDDDVVVTSSRRLVRLAVAAADVGARFGREGTAHDPADWLTAPRDAFDGRPAMEACQERHGLLRSTVLHGVVGALDADPAALDGLIGETDGRVPGRIHDDPPRCPSAAGPRLLSAWIDAIDAQVPRVQFCAMVCDDPTVFARRLLDRFGPEGAGVADVAVGFDPSSARATAFLSAAMIETLSLAAEDPSSPFHAGLDVVVEQRFGA